MTADIYALPYILPCPATDAYKNTQTVPEPAAREQSDSPHPAECEDDGRLQRQRPKSGYRNGSDWDTVHPVNDYADYSTYVATGHDQTLYQT